MIPKLSAVLVSLMIASVAYAQAPAAQVGLDIPGAVISNVRVSTSSVPAKPAPAAATATAETAHESNAPKNATFSVKRGDVPPEDLGKVTPSIYDVTSNTTLRMYSIDLMAVDPGLEGVSLKKDQTLEARYATRAKLLGFIPVRMPTYVRIATDGSVAVRYPWYRFLLKPEFAREDVEAALKAEAARTVSRGDAKSGKPAPVLDDRITNVDPVTQVVTAATGTPLPGTALTLRLRASIMEQLTTYLHAQQDGTLERAS